MKLFYKPGSCSLASHIILCETKKNFTLSMVDLQNKCLEDGSSYLVINPKGQVPSLLLNNGILLTENSVILQYLSDDVPGCQLLAPVGTIDRYKILEWINYISTELHKNFIPLFRSDTPTEYQLIIRRILKHKMEYVNSVLEDKYWIYGQQFTIADAYLFTVLRWAFNIFNIEKLKNIIRYMEYIIKYPSVFTALKSERLI